MFNVKALREKIADEQGKALAIQTLVQNEKREATAEEVAELDRIQGHGDSKGVLDKLNADLERAVKLETIRAKQATKQFDPPGLGGDNAKPQIVFPSVRGKLKSFTGPTAARDAYTTGQFLAATCGSVKAKQWLAENGIPMQRDVQNAHSASDNTKGGYLVPEVTENTIIRLIEDFGSFRRNVARVWPVMGTTKVPKRAGGFTVYHTGENEEITDSELALAQVELTPKKASVLTQLSNELSEDALSVLGDLLVQEFAYAFAYDEDNAGFNGDGTESFNKIVGLNNALLAGSIFNASGGKTSILNFTLADWAAVQARARRYRGFNPKWYVHSEVYFGAMVGLMSAAGGNTIETLANGDRQQTFLGRPVEFVELLPNSLGVLATTTFGYFGDLSQAVEMGDSRGVTIASDSSVFFKQDALGIRGTQRYDIKVHGTGTATRADSIVAFRTA